jgi:hypothetical protein
MAAAIQSFSIHFPEDYDARAEFETPSKGFLGNIVVQLENGARYQVFFMDPVRLQQELRDEEEEGQPYFAEVNLVIVPQVTTAAIHKAVQGLWQDGFFNHLKPLDNSEE